MEFWVIIAFVDGSELSVLASGLGGIGILLGGSLGRKAEFMSPIPTKKSSTEPINGVQPMKRCRLTWHNFDEIWAPFPNVTSIVDNDHHGGIAGK